MKEKKYTVIKWIKGKGTEFDTDKYDKGDWFIVRGKKYTVIKWEKEKNIGLFDTKKDVVLIEWTNRKKNNLFGQNHIDNFIMKLGFDPKIYDESWVVDALGFSSNKDFDLTFFFVEKDNSIRMSIVSKNKEARKKLDMALKYIGNI